MNPQHAQGLHALILQAERMLDRVERTPQDQIVKQLRALIADLKAIEHNLLRELAS